VRAIIRHWPGPTIPVARTGGGDVGGLQFLEPSRSYFVIRGAPKYSVGSLRVIQTHLKKKKVYNVINTFSCSPNVVSKQFSYLFSNKSV